jgi:hypothetical protein
MAGGELKNLEEGKKQYQYDAENHRGTGEKYTIEEDQSKPLLPKHP